MWKPHTRTRDTQGTAKLMNFLNVHVDEIMVNINLY
jgi:hypothetical protein